MKKRTNMLRSKLGGHFAGTGIVTPEDMQDDFIKRRTIKVHRSDILPTDRMEDEEFDEYCKQMSGEVKVSKLEETS